MRSRKHRIAAVVVAFVAAVAPVVATSAGAGVCPPGAHTDAGGAWTRIAVQGIDTLTTYSVRAAGPRELYASDGVRVMRSFDSGCTWGTAFEVGVTPSAAAPMSSASATVTSLVTPAGRAVYAVVTDGARVHVLRSADNGATWKSSDVAAVQPDATATDAKLVVSKDVMFLLTGASPTSRSATGRMVYVSRDGGASWSVAPFATALLLTAPDSVPRLTDLAVNPDGGQGLLAATTVGLFQSLDGGTSWLPVGIGGGSAIDTVAIERGVGGYSIVAVDNAAYTAYVTTDSGGSWTAINLPDTVESAAMNPRQATAVVGSEKGVFQAQLNVVGLTPMWTGNPLLTQVKVDAASTPLVYACSCGDQQKPGIWRRADVVPRGNSPFAPPEPPIVIPGVLHDDYTCYGTLPALKPPKDWGRSRVEPETTTLTLAPGQSVTLPYRVVAAPRPFEVYFLTETGAKAEFSVCPFETGAVSTTNALIDKRDIRVGLGDYRDYPGQTDEEWGNGGPTGSGHTYLRRATMAVPGSGLPQALARLSWKLGPDAAGASAIYQAVTGVGQDLAPAGPSLDDILGGQQANFSADAYKVLMHITGKWFNDPKRSPGYPGVPIDKALDALKARGIKQLGIWVNNTGNKQSQGRQRFDGRGDVHRFATQTGAVATKSIDCNSDGFNDIDPGDPLVCDWLSLDASHAGWTSLGDESLGREMTKLLLALRDPQPVRLVATEGAQAVPAVNPPSFSGVDLLQPSTHDFAVTFRCDQANHDVPVTLSGIAGEQTIAQSRVLLHCGRPMPAAKPPAGIVVPPPPPVPPAPNPLPHPAPNPGPNPVPQPAANPAPAGQAQAQAQPVAQGVVVPQAQVEPQLAFEKASSRLGQEEMSAIRSPRDRLETARQVALAGGACLLLAFGSMYAATARAEERRRGSPR